MRVVLRQLTSSEAQAILDPGASVGWPGVVYPGALPPAFVLRRALANILNGEPGLWWLPFLIIHPEEQAVLGGCAFKGPPRSGRAEVLYGVSKSCRGRGIASAAVAELALVAFDRGAVEVLAEIEPRNSGSIGVARKCGFKRLGKRLAEDDAVVEQWVLSPS